MRRSASSIKRLTWLVGICLVVATVGTTFDLPSPGLPVGEPRPAAAAATAGLLAFTAGGHVLGFRADGVYVASGDHALRVEFAGTSGVAPVADQMPSSSEPAPLLGAVRYPDLWPGISLVYESLSGGIAKSSYLVAPGARVADIRLRYNVPVALDDEGGLSFAFATGQMRESAPVAWQEIEGERVPVEAAFALLAGGEVGFAVGSYDPRYGLVIDPSLTWNTFLGGTGTDYGSAIAVDSSGNIYVTGWSKVSWGSSPRRAFQSCSDPQMSGCMDAFVAKLDQYGALQWHTFLGAAQGVNWNNDPGFGDDKGYGIAVDGSGNVYVTGWSQLEWSDDPAPVVDPFATFSDAFVAKLNTNGYTQWLSFLGSGLPQDEGYGIAVDGSGNVYVVGDSYGNWGDPLRPFAVGTDAFVAKLNSSGALQWNTFLVGSLISFGRGIVLDGDASVYVAGWSMDGWGGELTVNPYSGGDNTPDAFVAKLNTAGALQWNTFLGGVLEDYGRGITRDGSGNLYVVGSSSGPWGSPVRSFTSGGAEAFVAKLNSTGVRQWHTFLGGPSEDIGYSVALDGSGKPYVAGKSMAPWGTANRGYRAGASDAFAARLNSSSGALEWNTFLGGMATDEGFGIAYTTNNLYVVGRSDNSSWGNVPVGSYTSGDDAFVSTVDLTSVESEVRVDWLGSCGGSGICYDSLMWAINQVTATNGTVNLYEGTYGEAITLTQNVTVTLMGDATITDTFTMGSGIFNLGSYTLTLTGDWDYTGGTFNAGTGTVELGGSGSAQSVPMGLTFNNIVLNNPAGTSSSGSVIVQGDTEVMTGTYTAWGTFGGVQVDSGSAISVADAGSLSIGGDWTNNGSFTHNDRAVSFTKSGVATLSKAGTGSTETFCSLTVNAATILDVTDDYIDLAGGCSLTNNGAIRREAPAQNAATETPVTFNDPLGDPTAILNSTGTTPLGSTSVTVTVGQTPQACNWNPFSGTPVKRWYRITPETTTGISVTVRLYYAPTDANGTTASNVVIFHCGDSGGWTELSGSYTRGIDENGNYYVEVPNVTSFSDFGGGEGAPTAVEVSSLGARGTAGSVEVTWATGTEVGMVGFNVWRALASGGEWTKLNSLLIPIAGDLMGKRYDYVDRTALPGVRYEYRLEVVDSRGQSAWYGPVGAARWGWSLYLPFIWR